MNKYYYDFHIHSCLSPCADNDNTPANLAGTACLAGLNIMALTDHNTTLNCPAFFKAAKRNGIIPIAGMELTTAEDIHVVCLFEELQDAMAFNEEVASRRILIKNRTDIFGDQFIVDENDEVVGIEENLLSNATTITVEEAPLITEKYNGICYPAHIDRISNGIIATLGTLPDIKGFYCAEFHDATKIEEHKAKYSLDEKTILVSSDAHYLWDIRDKEFYFELEDEPYSSSLVRKKLFERLKRYK